MKSVRLDDVLEARLKEAARLARVPESSIIRDAIALRCDAILADRPNHQLDGIIGAITSRGGRAQRAHRRFGELVKKDRVRKAKRASPRSPS